MPVDAIRVGLIADCENQIGQEYNFDQDAVWEQATKPAKAVVAEAPPQIAMSGSVLDKRSSTGRAEAAPRPAQPHRLKNRRRGLDLYKLWQSPRPTRSRN
jgi:hypothetical protein